MKLVELTPRLQSVAEWVPWGARLVDVGTDHAHLPVWLLQQGIIEHGIATDVRLGPLQRAKATAKRYELTGSLSFRLCDGLKGVTPEEVDTIVIAGMGGETITQILAAASWTRTAGYQLILQPMSSLPDLRKWLSENGYRIEQERLVREGERLYSVFLVAGGEDEPLTLTECWLGRAGKDDPLREDYLLMLQRRCQRALDGLNRSEREDNQLRKAELALVLKAIQMEVAERRKAR